jgi:hypothetical protein
MNPEEATASGMLLPGPFAFAKLGQAFDAALQRKGEALRKGGQLLGQPTISRNLSLRTQRSQSLTISNAKLLAWLVPKDFGFRRVWTWRPERNGRLLPWRRKATSCSPRRRLGHGWRIGKPDKNFPSANPKLDKTT